MLALSYLTTEVLYSQTSLTIWKVDLCLLRVKKNSTQTEEKNNQNENENNGKTGLCVYLKISPHRQKVKTQSVRAILLQGIFIDLSTWVLILIYRTRPPQVNMWLMNQWTYLLLTLECVKTVS